MSFSITIRLQSIITKVPRNVSISFMYFLKILLSRKESKSPPYLSININKPELFYKKHTYTRVKAKSKNGKTSELANGRRGKKGDGGREVNRSRGRSAVKLYVKLCDVSCELNRRKRH